MQTMDSALATIENNPLATAAGAAIGGVAVGVGAAALLGSVNKRKNKRSKSSSSRKKRGRIKHTKRGWRQDRKRRSKQPWEVAYRKRKSKRSGKRSKSSRSRRGVHYAKKTGQPYILLANGKAKFIKGKRRKR